MTRILAIHAHPDDIEIFAGGTLALLAARGHNITLATMTPGDCGSIEQGPDETAAIRRREAAASAAQIGARYLCVELRDMAVFNDDFSRRRVVEILRLAAPELVLTSSPVDYHCDHEAASVLVRDACFAAPAPNYRTQAVTHAPPLKAIPHLYYMDSVNGVDREGRPLRPHFVVNVEQTFARKREMLAAHASQRNWLRHHHGTDDYLEMMERWTRDRGALAGLTYAEGFRPYHGHPYPQTPLFEELLGKELVCHSLIPNP